MDDAGVAVGRTFCRQQDFKLTMSCWTQKVLLEGGQGLPERMACLTSLIAFVISMPRGQASEQLKVVRQRHTPSLSLRMSRRTWAASSRSSKMKRCAFTIAAGPKYWP